MTVNDIQCVDEALAYMTECELATVEELAVRKTKSRRAYDRHIAIAQVGVDWLVRSQDWVIEMTCRPRVITENYEGSVRAWAEQMEERARVLRSKG